MFRRLLLGDEHNIMALLSCLEIKGFLHVQAALVIVLCNI